MGEMNSQLSGDGKGRGLAILLTGGVAAGLLMAALTIFGPQQAAGPRGGYAAPTPIPERVAVGEPAPDFTGQTPEGETISLSDLRGSPVAVNFWATWCAPCRVEMPALQEASARYADEGLVILAVNAGESAGAVKSYAEELGLTFPLILDPDGEIIDLYAVRFFPTTVWVDAEGRVQAKHLGPLTPDLIDRYVADLTQATP